MPSRPPWARGTTPTSSRRRSPPGSSRPRAPTRGPRPSWRREGADMEPLAHPIDLADVQAAYGRRAVLKGCTLRVPAGSTTVLLGSNGEGKTTLLRLCLGVLRPRAGTVRVLGLDPLKAP